MAIKRGRVEIFLNPPILIKCPTCKNDGIQVFWHRGYSSWYMYEHYRPHTPQPLEKFLPKVFSCPRSAKSLGKHWTLDLMEFL